VLDAEKKILRVKKVRLKFIFLLYSLLGFWGGIKFPARYLLKQKKRLFGVFFANTFGFFINDA